MTESRVKVYEPAAPLPVSSDTTWSGLALGERAAELGYSALNLKVDGGGGGHGKSLSHGRDRLLADSEAIAP